MCDSTDIVKQDGLYVCQHCGTKYSVEEARKLMGKVEVEGTVKVDKSDALKNLYVNARRARDTDNAEEALKYYNKILEIDAQDWEAVFYSVYFSCVNSINGELHSNARTLCSTIDIVLNLIQKSTMDETQKAQAVDEVALRTISISVGLKNACEHYLSSIALEYSNKYRDNEYIVLVKSLYEALFKLLDFVERNYPNIRNGALVLNIADALGVAIDWGAHAAWILKGDESQAVYAKMREYVQRVRKHRPNYNAELQRTIDKGGCYIATCVYGSYDCPEVWTLRRFRDDVLATNVLGRTFIRTYYAVSPTVVKLFGDSAWFKSMWRGPLNALVKALMDKGVSDKPYQDKQW